MSPVHQLPGKIGSEGCLWPEGHSTLEFSAESGPGLEALRPHSGLSVPSSPAFRKHTSWGLSGSQEFGEAFPLGSLWPPRTVRLSACPYVLLGFGALLLSPQSSVELCKMAFFLAAWRGGGGGSTRQVRGTSRPLRGCLAQLCFPAGLGGVLEVRGGQQHPAGDGPGRWEAAGPRRPSLGVLQRKTLRAGPLSLGPRSGSQPLRVPSHTLCSAGRHLCPG